MVQRPQSEQNADGTWRAWYVGMEWTVTSATQPTAIAELQAEFQRRTADPSFREQLYTLAQNHLDHPEKGIVAETITRDEYETRTSGPSTMEVIDVDRRDRK